MTHYDRKNPFFAKIKSRILLNKRGSTKRTYHITIDLKGSNLTYKAGDSIGIFPQNPQKIVDALSLPFPVII